MNSEASVLTRFLKDIYISPQPSHAPLMPSSASLLRTALFCVVMIALASASNAVMDTLATRYDRSIFAQMSSHQQWLDPRISWVNKWKDGDPKHGEAFPLSSTALACTTDAWHFFKTLAITFLTLALIAPWTHLIRLRWWGWVLIFFAIQLLHGLVFETLFAHVLLQPR